ncbi:hypothetical protein [Flavobacterium aquiphilum]|uniref:hypothetical protein n=1 Tax=Flavobacterium aquiphilum TaxID=3003261 RepID=UPI00247FEE67|nr:hypothetical protein [Flavobacterium aquiphilum]
MKNKFIQIFYLCLAVIISSCSEDKLPNDSTLESPIGALILTVNGVDYTAIPKLSNGQTLNDTLSINVKIPSPTGIVKQISLTDKNASASVKQNDNVVFVKNVLPIKVTNAGGDHNYYVKMNFTPPPFMYFIKTSDKDASGKKYFLNTLTAQRIVSGTYDNKFEGYIDLTGTNWDNIGLIKSDKTVYFDYNGGWWPEKSSGSFNLTEEASPGTGYFSCSGPWADWNWANANTSIVSPGIWKFNFDSKTNKLDLVETQFAITGSASGSVQAMTYSSIDKTWSITANLNAGKFKFTTIPFANGDLVVTYGELSNSISTGSLVAIGNDIQIASSGKYKILLNLSSAPNYNYIITKI